MIRFANYVLISIILTGCTFAHGPTLKNDLSEDLSLIIHYSDGSSSTVSWSSCQVIHAGGIGPSRTPNKEVISFVVYLDGVELVRADEDEVDAMIKADSEDVRVWSLGEDGLQLSERSDCTE